MVPPLPVNERTILRLIRHLSNSGVASTIKVYLLTIRSLHVQQVFPGSFTWMSSNTLGVEGLRRIMSSSREPKVPITPLSLYVIRGHLGLRKFEDSMLRTVCCSAF